MFEDWCTIIFIVLIIVYPKIKDMERTRRMQRESEYRIRNGIKTDYNKVIELSAKKAAGQITRDQYINLLGTGYTRKVENNGDNSKEIK